MDYTTLIVLDERDFMMEDRSNAVPYRPYRTYGTVTNFQKDEQLQYFLPYSSAHPSTAQ